ncbi:hypothetical protein Pmar_PMAR021916 [Perkinsus marinus ATCC 50983]|uniref:t-SNARE coiled-coil homology domain-containing protein n=1 Tax=Perkinsus marinus (strain ATCC 50983 / TXsc) TaxID=423536 RepID=C5KE93_PERM5|nr:hypothetical protein Pmar_PMAR021916 [Perkinsus marinus ATCC 50983]EER17200.1 hypothetical protein Pmar_PMAR021916 [Perkinsus marinus ATCC 50983]|eukprot:XP_002785404.1 hypothetical protein Pmar_PMAR021916 [Perkinsus marinus ATCC 50983]
MFRDLAVMVSDQGQQISSVENSVDTTVRDSKGEMTRFSLNYEYCPQRLFMSWRKLLDSDIASAIGPGV